MLAANKFVELWEKNGDELVRFPQETVNRLNIPILSKTFLVKSGLPRDASPFLSFGTSISGKWLPAMSEEWHFPVQFSCYRIIGATGNGDPICLDESTNGAVVYLNHDKGFDKFFMNSSVEQLGECLLEHRKFVRRVIDQNGCDAYLDGSIPGDLKKWISNRIRDIDEYAMRESCFWHSELA